MATSLTTNFVLQKTRLDNMRHVRTLNACGAQVTHIHVLKDAINAEVLSLSVNLIEDLSPLSFLERLRELYLRKNCISDLMQVLHLSRLENLAVLSLSENPIANDPSYRPFTIAAIPSLLRLDDRDITAAERREAFAEFAEVHHWPPPDPIPMGQVQGNGGMPNGPSQPPQQQQRNEARSARANSAAPAPQTARRAVTPLKDLGGASPKLSEERVPATARRPSTPSASAGAYGGTHGVGGGDFFGGGGGGWDDVPVGGGRGARGARRPPPPPPAQQQQQSARSNGTQHRDPFDGFEVLAPPAGRGGQRGGGAGGVAESDSSASSIPPAFSKQRSSQSFFGGGPTAGATPERAAPAEGSAPLPPPTPSSARRTRGDSDAATTASRAGGTPPSQQQQQQQQQYFNNAASPFAPSPLSQQPSHAQAVEDGILRAIKVLVDQLSAEGVAELNQYTAQRM